MCRSFLCLGGYVLAIVGFVIAPEHPLFGAGFIGLGSLTVITFLAFR